MSDYTIPSRGKCPYCLLPTRFEQTAFVSQRVYPIAQSENIEARTGQVFTPIHQQSIVRYKEPVNERGASFYASACAACGGVVVVLQRLNIQGKPREKPRMVFPFNSSRPIPAVVKEQSPHIASDYEEAASVLELSPKASAALSRRCLQAILSEKGNANQRNLVQQIEAVLPSLPSYIADNVDAIRNVGNFAAHPLKEQATGQILDVEVGEAEWNLDVLDMLFDFYYVQPEIAKEKREKLNERLQSAGKPPLKGKAVDN